MPASMPSERDPLLPHPEVAVPANPKTDGRVGPMEISRSTRYGILAGIWAATFLSVCSISSQHVVLSVLNVLLSNLPIAVIEQCVWLPCTIMFPLTCETQQLWLLRVSCERSP